MKKIFTSKLFPAIILCAILIFALALVSCNQNNNGNGGSNPGNSDDNVTPETPSSYYKTDAEVIALANTMIADAQGFEKESIGYESESLVSVFKETSGKGYIAYVLVMSRYGTPETESLIHVSNTGSIKNIKSLIFKTSDAMYGFVPPAQDAVDAFYAGLIGRNVTNIAAADIITGATSTSNNVIDSIKEALLAISYSIRIEIPGATTEEQIKECGNSFFAANSEYSYVDLPGEYNYLRRLFKEKSGLGFVAYIVAISENYGTVESEMILVVSNSGHILGNALVTWKTSDAIYGYVPPTAEEVEAFQARLLYQNSATINSVDLVTNATNTSTNLMNGIKEALGLIDSIIASPELNTPASTLESYAAQLAGKPLDLESIPVGESTNLQRVWKDNKGAGYFAYVLVISSYGTPETESLIHVDNDGNIKGIYLMTWKTSDAMYGYVPPTLEEAVAFYQRLEGKNLSNIDSVELVTNATSTSTKVINSFKEALTFIASL